MKKTNEEPSATAPASIDGAILVAQQALDKVGKDATNKFHNYSYTSSEGMLSACRAALHSAGLIVRRTHWRIDPTIGEFGTLVSDIVVAHPESGTKIVDNVMWPIVPEKGRPFDKALAGALTTSLNYFLRDLLQVPREEETMDTRNDKEYEPRRAPSPPPSRPAPSAAPARPAQQAAPKQQAAAQDDGEYLRITCKYVDEGVSGQKQSPYVKVKTDDGTVYFCWDVALHPVLLASKGKAIWVIVEESRSPNSPQRIVQVRTAPPADQASPDVIDAGDDDVPF